MGFLIRLIIFPLLVIKRILLPMAGGILKTPFRFLGIIFKSKLVLMAVVLGALFMAMQGGHQSPQHKNEPPIILTKEEDPRTREKITELPPLPAVIADGNSPFTPSLWGKMKVPDQTVYSREFSFSMQYGAAGEAYLFKTPNGLLFGEITPGKVFKTKTGNYCRTFEELIVFQGEAQKYHGKSCMRAGKGGWCRLGPESTPTCELGYSEGTMGDIRRTMRRWF